MENHPIPQDVTGFQFKLIGDMTVKQFAFLASGILLAWFCYILPISFLFRFPFIVLFAGFGAGLAFVPIEGRPMDVMIRNFVKALLSPTQFIYQKQGGHVAIFAMQTYTPNAVTASVQSQSPQKLQELLQSLDPKPKNKLDEKETLYFQSLFSPQGQSSSVPSPIQSSVMQQNQPPVQPVQAQQPPLPEPQPQVVPQTPQQQETQLATQAETLESELEKAKQQEATSTQPLEKAQAHALVSEFQQQLQVVTAQKEALENQLKMLLEKLTLPPQPTAASAQPQAPVQTPQPQPKPQPAVVESTQLQIKQPHTPKPQGPSARKVAFPQKAPVGMPIAPENPNIIAGIVRDARGNILSNILVEIKDQDGSPIRAFKTNTLGQFASATQLPNGTYTIVFEDPQNKHNFESIELSVNGQIIQPLEIISTDDREQLRKELFG